MTRMHTFAFTLMACTAIGGASIASGQTRSPAAPARCDAILTAEEAVAAVGEGYAGPAVDEPRPGFTRCEWQGNDTNFGFTFASLKTLVDEGTTAEQTFDMDLQAVEDAGRKREILPGIGVTAATVALGDGAALLEVQRADGVARMVLYKVDREKMLALARAIATP